ncbi:MAG TPA: DMT family transporter [Thermoanaerobaculia bacterium]|nr:DMT family transporter [Thermoanaerobaculia bacterium]
MNERRTGLLYIVLAALLWSTGGIGIKAVDDPPLKVTFYRSVFAAITLFAIFGWRTSRPPLGGRTGRPPSRLAFAAAIISYGLCLTAFVIATKWTTAANAIFLQYAGVVWVLLLSPLVVREPMRSRDAITIAVALGGMALFFVGRFEARGMAGNAMALVSSVFFALLILSLRREHDAARAAVTWGNVFIALALLPFVANDLALSMKSFLALAFLGVFQIAFAYAAFVKGLKHVTATEASLTGMLEPVANPIWVALFLGERPSVYAIAGGAVVLTAIAWHTMKGEPATEMPAPD